MNEADKIRYPDLDPSNPFVMNKVLHLARYYLRNLTKPNDLKIEEDIQQIVLMKLLDFNKEVTNPQAYLSIMVRNEVIKYLKKLNYFQDLQIDEKEDAEFDKFLTVQATQQLESEMKAMLSEIWKELDEKNQHILNLLIFGYNQIEIAAALNITHDAARQRVSRLKNKLKSLIFSGDSMAHI